MQGAEVGERAGREEVDRGEVLMAAGRSERPARPVAAALQRDRPLEQVRQRGRDVGALRRRAVGQRHAHVAAGEQLGARRAEPRVGRAALVGDPLARGAVDDHPLAVWVVVDLDSGERIANKRGPTDPRLRASRAELLPGGELRVTLPDGTAATGDGVERALSDLLGRRVALSAAARARLGPTAPPAATRTSRRSTLTTRTLAHLRALRPEIAWDVRRFRANLVLDDGDAPGGFSEDALVGRALSGPGGLRMTVGLPTPRASGRRGARGAPGRSAAPARARRRAPGRPRRVRRPAVRGRLRRGRAPGPWRWARPSPSARRRSHRTRRCGRRSRGSRPSSARERRGAPGARRRLRLRGRTAPATRPSAAPTRGSPPTSMPRWATRGPSSTSAPAPAPTSRGIATSSRSSPPPRCARSARRASCPPSTRRPSAAVRRRRFDAAMAMITIHQWPDLDRGLRELRRVARGPVVILTFDGDALDRLWLGDYVAGVVAAEAAPHARRSTDDPRGARRDQRRSQESRSRSTASTASPRRSTGGPSGSSTPRCAAPSPPGTSSTRPRRERGLARLRARPRERRLGRAVRGAAHAAGVRRGAAARGARSPDRRDRSQRTQSRVDACAGAA